VDLERVCRVAICRTVTRITQGQLETPGRPSLKFGARRGRSS
jgi:hypothetical protein